MEDMYLAGYNYFLEQGDQEPEFIKVQPYLFRVGFERSKKDSLKNNSDVLVNMTIYPVERTVHTYKATYQDIMGTTRKHRFKRLHDTPELSVVLDMIIDTVEKHSHKAKSYRELSEMADKALNIILQYYYDIGKLTKNDLASFEYIPVEK